MSFITTLTSGFFVQSMNSFEGITTEDIGHCALLELSSGLRTRLYYAPASFFLKIDLPKGESYVDAITIEKEGIEFKGGGWSYIDILVDENEVKYLLSGSLQRKKSKTDFDFYVLGFRSEVIGFLEKNMNTPLVFAIGDSNSNNWVIGNLRNRAFISSGEGSTGRKYEDNSGMMAKITCNSCVYRYNAPLDSIELAAAFSKGFSLGFNS